MLWKEIRTDVFHAVSSADKRKLFYLLPNVDDSVSISYSILFVKWLEHLFFTKFYRFIQKISKKITEPPLMSPHILYGGGMRMTEGIDVSVYQGVPDWNAVRAGGVTFAMIKASQGRSETDGSVRLFEDAQYRRNLRAASAAGIRCGVYHYLTAVNLSEADEEAAFFVSLLPSERQNITLWAAVDAESRYLPRDRILLTKIVSRFCDKVRAAGFRPMLYTNPDFLKNRLDDVSAIPLWLALWRDVSFPPEEGQYPGLTLWQWGRGTIPGIAGVCDRNLALRELPPLPGERRFYAEEVCRYAGLSDTTKEFLSLYKYGDDLFRKLYEAIIRGGE